MNGRNMVLPNRDRVEKWAGDRVRIEPSLVRIFKATKSLLPPSGALNIAAFVCVCDTKL